MCSADNKVQLGVEAGRGLMMFTHHSGASLALKFTLAPTSMYADIDALYTTKACMRFHKRWSVALFCDDGPDWGSLPAFNGVSQPAGVGGKKEFSSTLQYLY